MTTATSESTQNHEALRFYQSLVLSPEVLPDVPMNEAIENIYGKTDLGQSNRV